MREAKQPEIKILIVDDDETIAGIFKDTIEAEDRTVTLCHDGLTAMDYIRQNGYDLILVDLVMPQASGLDILKFAKEVNPETVVMIITGYASLETALTAIKEGAYDYIRKPCKLEEIRLAVDNAIDKIRLNRENRALLEKLQAVYHQLTACKPEKNEYDKIERINFFPAHMPSFHYLSKENAPADNYIEKLRALSSLKKSGTLSEDEFDAFKKHLLKAMRLEA